MHAYVHVHMYAEFCLLISICILGVFGYTSSVTLLPPLSGCRPDIRVIVFRDEFCGMF